MGIPSVLFVYEGGSGLGDEIRIREIMKSLRKSGVNITVASLPAITTRNLRNNGLADFLKHLFPFNPAQVHHFSRSLIQTIEHTVRINVLRRLTADAKFDVIIAETTMVAWLVHRAIAPTTPVIVDVHGLSGIEARGRGDPYWIIRQRMEDDALGKSEYILTVSPIMSDYLTSRLPSHAESILIVRNGATPQHKIAEYRDPLRVVYAGAFSYWENVDLFLDVAKAAEQSHYEFFLAGAGSMKGHILKRITNENIPVKYIGHVPRQRMLSLLTRMQIGFAPSTKDLARRVAFPIKVLDYMSCGLPVICARVGDWGRMVDAEDCGFALKDDSIDMYLKALDALSDPAIWARKSNNGVLTIRNKYSWEKVVAPLIRLVSRICS